MDTLEKKMEGLNEMKVKMEATNAILRQKHLHFPFH